MINSRQKGARGERMFRDELRAQGYTARRGQQFAGGTDSPDVICEELDRWIHWEIKFTERLSLYDAVAQARRDAGSKIPVVVHKKKHSAWVAILPLEELFFLIRNAGDNIDRL